MDHVAIALMTVAVHVMYLDAMYVERYILKVGIHEPALKGICFISVMFALTAESAKNSIVIVI